MRPPMKKKIKAVVKVDLKSKEKWMALASFHDAQDYSYKEQLERARQSLIRLAAHGIECGKALYCIHEMEGRQKFITACNRLGVHERTGRLYISAAQEYTQWDPEVLNQLGLNRLYKLLPLSDEEREELRAGGEVHEKDIDDIKKMSGKEIQQWIKDATRNLREQKRKAEQRASKLEQEIDEANRTLANTRRELELERAGTPKQVDLPPWWREYETAIDAFVRFTEALDQHKPNLSDKSKCLRIYQRMQHEFARVTDRLLSAGSLNREAAAEAINDAVSDLTTEDGDFDWERFGRGSES